VCFKSRLYFLPFPHIGICTTSRNIVRRRLRKLQMAQRDGHRLWFTVENNFAVHGVVVYKYHAAHIARSEKWKAASAENSHATVHFDSLAADDFPAQQPLLERTPG
jgi:hypothetical protein